MLYLQQFLGILQEIETVFNPTSCNLCSLLSELFPALILRFTWVRWKRRYDVSILGKKGIVKNIYFVDEKNGTSQQKAKNQVSSLFFTLLRWLTDFLKFCFSL